jgi:hypothetical protein
MKKITKPEEFSSERDTVVTFKVESLLKDVIPILAIYVTAYSGI